MKKTFLRSLRSGAIALILSAAAVLSCASCSGSAPSPDDGRTVVTIGGEKINLDYYRYVFLNTRDDMDGGDRSFWDGNYAAQAELNDAVLGLLCRNVAIEKLAGKYGVKLSAAEKREAADAAKASASDDVSSLSDAYLTKYTAYYISCFTSLWRMIYDYVTDEKNGVIQCSDSDLLSLIPEKFTRISYIYISHDTENALASAIEANGKIEDGGDFSDAVLEYCEDESMRSAALTGYYYVEGEIIDEIAEIASGLDIGETSGVVDAENGYFIIKRLPVDIEYAKSDLSVFREKYFAYVFNAMVDEIEGGLEIKYGKLYSELTVETVR